jgi:ABC-type molybdate transport system substrate-binding protein
VTARSAQPVVLVVLLALAAALTGGCGRRSATAPGGVSRDPNTVLAYVCCGFVPAIEAAKVQFEADNRGKSLRIDSGEPETLVERIRSGAVPDVLIFPGDAEIGVLEREGFLDRGSRQEIGTLRVAIAVRRDDPITINGYADLVSDAVGSITMSTPGMTSLGTDGKSVLERAGVWPEIQGKLTLQTSALAALKQLVGGQADAAIVYDPCFALNRPDAVPPGSLRFVTPRDTGEERPVGVYIIVHKRSPNALLAQRLIRLLASRPLEPPPPPLPPPAEEQPEGPE